MLTPLHPTINYELTLLAEKEHTLSALPGAAQVQAALQKSGLTVCSTSGLLPNGFVVKPLAWDILPQLPQEEYKLLKGVTKAKYVSDGAFALVLTQKGKLLPLLRAKKLHLHGEYITTSPGRLQLPYAPALCVGAPQPFGLQLQAGGVFRLYIRATQAPDAGYLKLDGCRFKITAVRPLLPADGTYVLQGDTPVQSGLRLRPNSKSLFRLKYDPVLAQQFFAAGSVIDPDDPLPHAMNGIAIFL